MTMTSPDHAVTIDAPPVARRRTKARAKPKRPSRRDELVARLGLEEDVVVQVLPAPSGDVLWIDLGHRADADMLHGYLEELHPGIELELVRDLVERDELAQAEDCDGDLRHVSAVGFVVGEAPRSAGTDCVDFQMVEMLAGPDWLVTCWQDSLRLCAAEGRRDAAPVLRDAVRREVLNQWTPGGADDLGTLVSARLTARYKHSFCTVERWLQEWELAFHSNDEVAGDPAHVKHLLGVVNEARRRLTAFNNARRDGEGWFLELVRPDVSKSAAGQLKDALDRLLLLFEHVRADIELVAMERMLEQAKASAHRDEQERRFEKNLAKVTALLLVPTLIAGVFGANTWVPGEHSWLGFDGMIALMVVASVTVYLTLVRRDRREDEADRARSATSS